MVKKIYDNSFPINNIIKEYQNIKKVYYLDTNKAKAVEIPKDNWNKSLTDVINEYMLPLGNLIIFDDGNNSIEEIYEYYKNYYFFEL